MKYYTILPHVVMFVQMTVIVNDEKEIGEMVEKIGLNLVDCLSAGLMETKKKMYIHLIRKKRTLIQIYLMISVQ